MSASSSPPSLYAMKLGYVPLIDAAPLIIAAEHGIFAKYDVEVQLRREVGWSTIRDKISFGELDGAHAPLGLTIALCHGFDCVKTPCVAPLMLSRHGNAITLSKSIPEEVVGTSGALLAHLTEKHPDRKPAFAAVHPWSSHAVMLQSWLAREGFTPGRDVDILYLPPLVLGRNLLAGTIDGFCVGEPWNSQAILNGSGWVTARSSTMVGDEFEKAFIMSEAFIHSQSDSAVRATAAILEALDYCSDRANADSIIEILARPEHLNCSEEILCNALSERFHSGHGEVDATSAYPFLAREPARPTGSAANWLITGLRMVHTLPESEKVDVARIFDTSFYEAAAKLAASAPLAATA